MSYAAAAALQLAVCAQLGAAPDLDGVLIVDAAPSGAAPDTWILLGAEEVRDASDSTTLSAEHALEIAVITRLPGFLRAKELAAIVSEVMEAGGLMVAGAEVAAVQFQRARARRLEGGAVRRIDLTYRIRLDLG